MATWQQLATLMKDRFGDTSEKQLAARARIVACIRASADFLDSNGAVRDVEADDVVDVIARLLNKMVQDHERRLRRATADADAAPTFADV